MKWYGINDAPAKAINNRHIRWEVFFGAKLNHKAPYVIRDIVNSLVEPYVCNCQLLKKEIISDIQEVKANKTLGGDGFRCHTEQLGNILPL